MSPSEHIDGFDTLAGLALDVRSCWNHGADDLWRQLGPELWDLTSNPWVVLQAASRDQLRALLSTPAFRGRVDAIAAARKASAAEPRWFQTEHAGAPLRCAAYFSMEFMLAESLPIYSGGLGNVAGDQLKAASDLGVPVVGIGLLYQRGYFRQEIDKDGAQQELYPYNDPGQLPVTPLRGANGEWMRLEVSVPGYSIWLRAWQVRVGRVKLYLLDTNDPANLPIHRGITSELYGGGPELRLRQEIVLGVGGWRLMEALGLDPEVCHLNEGHAALAVLERARSFMTSAKCTFHEALAVTRAGNLFTTHTAVAAGFDRFSPALVRQYLGHYTERLGISLEDVMALGRRDPLDGSEPFNMAYLAIRGSGSVNGVSRLHGRVSRHLFEPLFPRWPTEEVPVGHVTNGVHVPTWDTAASDALWTTYCGKDRWKGKGVAIEERARAIPDEALWGNRKASRKALVEFARRRLARQLSAEGSPPEAVETAKHMFDPEVLTIGFARRFAEYKRPNLLLRDPERLARLLTNKERPVQLILAGKAHPADAQGHALIKEWTAFIWREDIRPRAAFIADYDMNLTEQLVGGVDVWLNTPRRPWEACGTSGMKVLVNGGVNLSTLDGWWAEAFAPEVGWAIGAGSDGGEVDGPSDSDDDDARALYERLEREVIPAFYERDGRGIPVGWVGRMRESMARLTPQFSAGRAVREYVEQHYLPAAGAYRARAANNGAAGKGIEAWRRGLEEHWGQLRIGEPAIRGEEGKKRVELVLTLGELPPEAVRVELFANGAGAGATAAVVEMKRGGQAPGGYVYSVPLPEGRALSDFTARAVPARDGVAVPLEAPQILWQR
jgi:starch phosphorylase